MFTMKYVVYFSGFLILLFDVQCEQNIKGKNHGKLIGGSPVKEGEFSSMFVKVSAYTEEGVIGYEAWNRKGPQDVSGGIIINSEQVLVPASLTENKFKYVINPNIYATAYQSNHERFSVEKTCVMNRFGELDVGEKDLVQNQKPTIYDLAVLNLDRVLDNYPPNTGSRFPYALAGKIPLELGDAVTILSVGKDLAGREHGPRKLSATVIACPEKLQQEKTFCLDAHYACQSDKGSVVFKGNGSDGRIYGMITYSANCDPAKGLVAVRAMDLVRLQGELTELTKICLPHAKPLEFECWNRTPQTAFRHRSFIRVEQRSRLYPDNPKDKTLRTVKTCGGLLLNPNYILSTTNCIGTGVIEMSPVSAEPGIEKLKRRAFFQCNVNNTGLKYYSKTMSPINVAYFDFNQTIPLGVYPGCLERPTFYTLTYGVPPVDTVLNIVALGTTERGNLSTNQYFTQAKIVRCRRAEPYIICLESQEICPSDEGSLLLVNTMILGIVTESDGCLDGKDHTIKVFNLAGSKSIIDKLVYRCHFPEEYYREKSLFEKLFERLP